MIAIQLVSAHIGRVTGKGIAANAKQFCPFPMLALSVSLLVVANTINIAADIAAMAAALHLVIGGLRHEHAVDFRSIIRIATGVCALSSMRPDSKVSYSRPFLLRRSRAHH
jgi:hypothetical protein